MGLTFAIGTVVAFHFFTLVLSVHGLLLAEGEEKQLLRSCVRIVVLGLCVSADCSR